MSNCTATKTDVNTYELEFMIDRNAYDQETDKAFRKNASRLNIPGFRRGKAPRSIIEKMYGKDVFANEAIDALLPEAYGNAVKETGLQVVDRPDVDVLSIDEEGVHLKATVTVKPEVTLPDYVGIKASKPSSSVSPEEVDKEIENVRKRNARVLDVEDRPVQTDDEVTIDYEGFVDDQPFDGGTDAGYKLKIGSGSFIPGFEDQIIGHSKDEEFDIFVTFPEDYHASELAGKEARFHIALHDIQTSVLPDLDDEFVKDVSEFDTVDEYRASVEKKLAENKEKSADRSVKEQLRKYLTEHATIDVPKCMVDREIEDRVNNYLYRLESQGITWEMYSQYFGETKEQLAEKMRPESDQSVRLSLVLEKIAEKEELSVDSDELDKKFEELAKRYGMEVENIKAHIDVEALKASMLEDKAMEFVQAKAVIEEQQKAENGEGSGEKAE